MTNQQDENGQMELGPWTQEPLRHLSPEVIPFWEGLVNSEFRLCRCGLCGAHYWPYTICPDHAEIPADTEMQWIATSGEGSVFAVLVVEKVIDPAYKGEVPYALALVELDEGPLFPTRIATSDPHGVRIGMKVKIHYHHVQEPRQTFPFFAVKDDVDSSTSPD